MISNQVQHLHSARKYALFLISASPIILTQRILQELKDVIESMRWASAEETKLKTKEIEHYKSDIQRMTACREDSLEMQRRYSCIKTLIA